VRHEDGFTLVELIVTLAVTLVVFAATLTALGAFSNGNRTDILRAEMQERARNALDRVARGLRNVTAQSSAFPGALEQASAYSIAFITVDPNHAGANGENTSDSIRVRYCLSDSNPENETLYQQVRHWTGKTPPPLPAATACPDATAGDWEETGKLATNIVNRLGGQPRPLFVYSTTSTPQIVTVQTNVDLNLPPNVEPKETQLTTAVSLRNANRPPIVSFSATEINGHILLNGSESRDPEGLSLTYKWFDGTSQLPSTSETYETPTPLKVGSTHTFKLEVTDPGGLTSSATETVTIK
jgi:prepilin-type N-terminal cleavage/methylation domain-containing protein